MSSCGFISLHSRRRREPKVEGRAAFWRVPLERNVRISLTLLGIKNLFSYTLGIFCDYFLCYRFNLLL